jgi:hypothetical protein
VKTVLTEFFNQMQDMRDTFAEKWKGSPEEQILTHLLDRWLSTRETLLNLERDQHMITFTHGALSNVQNERDCRTAFDLWFTTKYTQE